MCGFLTEFSFEEQPLSSKDEFRELLALSTHRGPDSTLIHSEKKYRLGFNRLAILDLSERGDQPQKSPSGRYHIVFNGEIYNYMELAHKYELTDLRSTSDTEVLVHLMDKAGIENTLKALNGMFSITAMDTTNNELFMARDFAGIKPLFYSVTERGIVTASQFNQIFNHPWVKPNLELRKEIIKEYFGLGYMQAPNTIYQNIYQVKPGEWIKVSRNKKIEKNNFCTFNFDVSHLNRHCDQGLVSDYDKVFSHVIQKQLVSDVSLSAFLSGGIDSPLVCAQAIKQNADIEVFTIGVSHKMYDESTKATAYANHIRAKHHIEKIEGNELIDEIDNHFNGMTEPFGDYSSIPTYVITKKAREFHTTMLSGDGADELFFGYPRMLDIMQKQHLFKIPFLIRKPLVRLAIKLKMFKSWAPYMYKDLGDWVLGKHLHINKTTLDKLIGDTDFSNELKALYKVPHKTNKKGLLHWLRYNEFYAHLQRVLTKVDRMSMANSLEVRVPFLDKESIDFSWKIIPKIKGNKFIVKELLKKMMELYYPKELIENRKKGFSVPVEEWLRTYLKPDLQKVIFEIPFYGKEEIEMNQLKKFVSDYLSGKHQDAWGVWHVYAWQKWAIAENLIAKD